MRAITGQLKDSVRIFFKGTFFQRKGLELITTPSDEILPDITTPKASSLISGMWYLVIRLWRLVRRRFEISRGDVPALTGILVDSISLALSPNNPR